MVKEIPWKGRTYLRVKYPGVLPLSESQVEVLEGLSREGPTNAYRVAKRIGKAYSFVFNSLKESERRGLVTFKGEVKTEKGTTAKIYDLALEGVLLTLQREMRLTEDRWNHSYIGEIIEKYSNLLPLIFGKWEHFERMGVGKIARFRLKVLVDTYAADPLSLKKGTGFGFGSDKETEQLVCWFFYFQFHHFKYSETWMTALKQDEETKMYVIGELKAYQRRLKKLNILIDENISFLQGVE